MQKHLKANLHIVEMVADQEREGERREASLSWSCRIPEVTSAWFHERTECWAAPFLALPIPYKGLTHLNIQAYFYTAVSNSVLNKRVVVTGLGWPLDPRLWELFGVQTQLEPPPPLTAGRSTMLLYLSHLEVICLGGSLISIISFALGSPPSPLPTRIPVISA